jgi:carbon monoxide dehydrogenase subunit G
MDINKSISLKCRPEELWAWLTEFGKLQKWNSTILEEQHISTGEVKAGYITRVLIKEGKEKIWYENEILNYQPYKLLKISLKGGNLGKAPMYIDYEIIDNQDRVELVYKSSWKPIGFMLKLMYPVIKKMANKNVDEVLAALKNQIERQPV